MCDILLKHNPKVIKTESNPLNYTYLTYSDLMLTSVPDNSPTGKQNPGNSAPDLLLTIQSKLSLRLHRDWELLTTHSHSQSHATCGLAQPPELQSVRLQTSEGAVLSTTNNINNAHVSIRMDHDPFFFCFYIFSFLVVHAFRSLPLPRENRISVLRPAGNRKFPTETLSSASLRRITSWLLEDNIFLLLFSTPKSFGSSWRQISL